MATATPAPTQDFAATLARATVLPAIVVEDVADAAALGHALVEGGLFALELMLRTPASLDCLRAMTAVPGGLVGAGTVLDPWQAEAAVKAGARFLVSPGFSPALAAAAKALGVPLLPGAVTATEAMQAREAGITVVKFFPAATSGGVPALRALHGPLPDMRFCPTGGITAADAPAYLALPNVLAVGGTWVAPKDAVAQGDWSRITALAREARALRGG